MMDGKVALITGSTSGIGLGLAKALANKGCKIILHGLGTEQQIKDVKQYFLDEFQQDCDMYTTNLSDESAIVNMCEEILKKYGAVDILVNNAGFQHVCNVEDFPIKIFRTMMDVMVNAPFILCKYLVPAMREKDWGRIISMGSFHSLHASPGKTAYSAAKHAIAGFTKALALETAETGITANTICPGFAHTAIFEAQVKTLQEERGISTFDEAKKAFLEKYHPSKKSIEIEQLADLVLFLCSSGADEIRGSCISIDGGWSAK